LRGDSAPAPAARKVGEDVIFDRDEQFLALVAEPWKGVDIEEDQVQRERAGEDQNRTIEKHQVHAAGADRHDFEFVREPPETHQHADKDADGDRLCKHVRQQTREEAPRPRPPPAPAPAAAVDQHADKIV